MQDDQIESAAPQAHQARLETLLDRLRAHFARPYCTRLVITPAAPEGDGQCGKREGHDGRASTPGAFP